MVKLIDRVRRHNAHMLPVMRIVQVKAHLLLTARQKAVKITPGSIWENIAAPV